MIFLYNKIFVKPKLDIYLKKKDSSKTKASICLLMNNSFKLKSDP